VKDVIVYRARGATPVVQREVDRLSSELPEYPLFIVCFQREYESALHSTPGKIYCYGEPDLFKLPYPHKLANLNWREASGHHDLPLLKFFLEHPDFERYWLIEDDVRYSGHWPDIFSELSRSSADLLMTVVQAYAEVPGWYWWHSLVTANETIPPHQRIRGFLPFCRVSDACLRAIDRKYREAWGGHYEVTWPTIACASGLSLEDIGGLGSYTPAERRGRFYTATNSNWALFPGTFIYRPPFHDTGVSEFASNVTRHSMLWHPVKV
jgi:hypothetical protein